MTNEEKIVLANITVAIADATKALADGAMAITKMLANSDKVHAEVTKK